MNMKTYFFIRISNILQSVIIRKFFGFEPKIILNCSAKVLKLFLNLKGATWSEK